MTNIQIVVAIVLYILSVVAAIVLTIVSKKTDFRKFTRWMLILHLFLLVVFIYFEFAYNSHLYLHLSFLLFFCSGILLSGLVIRSDYPLTLKIYTAVFLSSIIVFLMSPSRTIRFITFTFNQNKTNSWNIVSNYFVEEEQSLLSRPANEATYKITRHYGVFHKTLARNIIFGNRIDSLRVLKFDEVSGLQIRGFFIRKYDTFEACDSLDLSVPFVASINNIIQKREHN
ncbi:MAG: hypothetical protein ABI772_13665 [Bacteroidota bacterium]